MADDVVYVGDVDDDVADVVEKVGEVVDDVVKNGQKTLDMSVNPAFAGASSTTSAAKKARSATTST